MGNGFDINIGMKTKYMDFYNFYKTVPSNNNLIIGLKKEIATNIKNWSDLELAFGKYTPILKNSDDFDNVRDDIVENFCDYLTEQEKMLELNKLDRNVFYGDLSNPEQYLTKDDEVKLNLYKNSFGASTWKINIITFNYTRVIERMLEDTFQNILIGSHQNGKVRLENIQHIHGYTNDRTIFGVNDLSQVGNSEFHMNEEVLEALIKPGSNEALGHNVDKTCETRIREANVICIFGSSLGDTDNHWWKLVGEQLRRKIMVVIFQKGEEVKPRSAHKGARHKRNLAKMFLDKTDLDDSEKQQFIKHIYVGWNTHIFSLLKT